MQYIIKCPFCGNTYSVNNQNMESMQCPSCAAQNTMKDVIRQEESAEERAARMKSQSQAQYQYQYQNQQQYQNQYQQNAKKVTKAVILVPVISCLLLLSCCITSGVISAVSDVGGMAQEVKQEINWDQKEENKPVVEVTRTFVEGLKNEDYDQIKECLYLPEGSFVTDDEVKTIVQNNIDGTYIGNDSIELSKMSYYQEVDANRRYFIYFNDDNSFQMNYRKDEATNSWKIALERYVMYDVQIRALVGQGIAIDGTELPETSQTMENERDDVFALYTIPVMFNREYTVSIDTAAGTLKRKMEFSRDDVNIVNIEDQGNEVLVSCQKSVIKSWTELYHISQKYKDIDDSCLQEARPYFDESVTDDQITQALVKLQELEAANPSESEYQLSVNGVEHFEAVTEDTFLISIYLTYDNKKENLYEWGHLEMRYVDGQWKISNPCNYGIFNGETIVRFYFKTKP